WPSRWRPSWRSCPTETVPPTSLVRTCERLAPLTCGLHRKKRDCSGPPSRSPMKHAALPFRLRPGIAASIPFNCWARRSTGSSKPACCRPSVAQVSTPERDPFCTPIDRPRRRNGLKGKKPLATCGAIKERRRNGLFRSEQRTVSETQTTITDQLPSQAEKPLDRGKPHTSRVRTRLPRSVGNSSADENATGLKPNAFRKHPQRLAG